MAENLDKMGLAASAKAIRDAVADFQKSNMRLGLALTLVKGGTEITDRRSGGGTNVSCNCIQRK